MEVSLLEILDAREKRVQRQNALLQRYGKPLICFTMNIAGPVKYSPLIARGFALGCSSVQAQLEGLVLLHSEKLPRHTGCEAFFVVDAPAELLKARMVAIEEADALGRLFDLDVILPDGTKVEREIERKCLLCGNSARVCGRSRAHSVEQLQEKTNAILREAVHRAESSHIAALAVKALLFEVATTPKPGLVDRENCGSHEDMDIFTFLGSAAVLQPYFAACALAGLESAGESPLQTFEKLRYLGRQAEQTMLHETAGVNTHKGAIFTMGVLCGAAGRLDAEDRCDPEKVLAQCAALCRGITQRDLGSVQAETTQTVGQRLYARFGITGVRGQAEAGFPAVLNTGLPVLEEGIARGLSLERAGCAALLAMLTATTDTNMIARSDIDTARRISREVALLLAKNRYPNEDVLRGLDTLFTESRLSPGGTADLLAATYFLHFLK